MLPYTAIMLQDPLTFWATFNSCSCVICRELSFLLRHHALIIIGISFNFNQLFHIIDDLRVPHRIFLFLKALIIFLHFYIK